MAQISFMVFFFLVLNLFLSVHQAARHDFTMPIFLFLRTAFDLAIIKYGFTWADADGAGISHDEIT